MIVPTAFSYTKQCAISPTQAVTLSSQKSVPAESDSLIEIERVTKNALGKTRKSYEVYTDSLLDINPSLWIASHLYSPQEILNLLFADSSQLSNMHTIFTDSEDEGADSLNIQFLFGSLKEVNRKIIDKVRQVTHEDVLYFYYLSAHLAKIPDSEKIRELISKEIYKSSIQSLSVEEKGKLARYAHLIDVPTEAEAHAFRQEILPYLYTVGRKGRFVQQKWESVSQILKQLSSFISKDLCNLKGPLLKLQDPYFSQVSDNELILNLNHLFSRCQELLQKLHNGQEVQLPKFYHGIKTSFKIRLTLPEFFLSQDILEMNSETSKFSGTFASTSLALQYGPPSVALPDSIAWRKEKYIYNSFRPENPKHQLSDRLDYWVSFGRSISYCQYDFRNKIAGYNLFSVVVPDSAVEEQRQLFSKYKIQPPIMGLTEAKLLEYYLANHPLLLPNHLAKQRVTLNPKFNRSVHSTAKQIVNTNLETSTSKKIKLSNLFSNENDFTLSSSYQKALLVAEKLPLVDLETKVRGCLASGIAYASLAFDKGIIYAQADSKRLPSNEFKLSTFFIYSITHSKESQEAILQGILTQKKSLKSKSFSKQQSYLAKLHLQRLEKFTQAKELFKLSDADLPPSLRHTWPHLEINKIPDGSVVGHQPLLAFNFANVQTLLLHQSLFLRDFLMKGVKETFESWLAQANNHKHFFGLLAYQLISQATDINGTLFCYLKLHSTIEVAIDYNTFDKGKESGRNFRCCPNEPLFTYRLLRMLSDEELKLLLRSFSFQFPLNLEKFLQPGIGGLSGCLNGPSHHNLSQKRALYLYDLLLEIGQGIYKRYFTVADRKRQLPLNLSNDPLLDVMENLSKDTILTNQTYNSLLID